VDLLTAVLHEMGHLAGLGDESTSGHAGDLMAETLAPGMRRVDALDELFAHPARKDCADDEHSALRSS
jgi:hypothetical protein